MSAQSTPRRRPTFPGSLTDLHRFRKTAHGHDGSSRIVMVRKTDQRTFASQQNGDEPTLETVTRETIETFRGQRTECKVTTEKKDFNNKCPPKTIISLSNDKVAKPIKKTVKKTKSKMEDFANECLKSHNELRKRHGVPSLKLNKKITQFSQDWANNLIKKNIFKHSGSQEYGENLYLYDSSNPAATISGGMAVESWYEEIKIHQYDCEPRNLGSGHFTQVIWKESRELGAAFARKGGKIVVVCNYFPAGNVITYFAQNVPRPLSSLESNNNNNKDESPKKVTTMLSQLCVSNHETFEEEFLMAHNIHRGRHGVPPLKLDRKLCKYSEEWAKHLASKNTVEHRPASNFGENIFCIQTSDPKFTLNGSSPVDKWYEDIKNHCFGREPNNLQTGHFTQVVWKSSEFLGVGFARNNQGRIIVVANYKPAGNFVGHFVENVLPLRSSLSLTKKESCEKLSLNDSSSSTSLSDYSKFALDALQVHNEYRRKHNAPELTLSKQLCDLAEDWAQVCVSTQSMTHRPNSSYGENMFYSYSSDLTYIPTAREAVKTWYDEVRQYNFDLEKITSGTLHFTQLVWKKSTKLGIAIASNEKGQHYVVANYDPRGNFVGQFLANVSRPRS